MKKMLLSCVAVLFLSSALFGVDLTSRLPGKPFPATGTRNVLFLTYYKPADWDYTATNFKNYYKENSYNKLTLNPVTYEVNDVKFSNFYYASGDVSTRYSNTATIYELIKAAYQKGINFSTFDNDGDGIVETVVLLYEGTFSYPGNYGSTNLTYSGELSGSYTDAQRTFGSVKVNHFIIAPVRCGYTAGSGTGALCHVFGHALGLPDFQNTTYWDVMSKGERNNGYAPAPSWSYPAYDEGTFPAQHNYWSKTYLGWATPRNMTDACGSKRIPDSRIYSTTGALKFFVNNVNNASEYFLLENRINRSGETYPASGLLVYHIDDNYIRNCIANHTTVPARGFTMISDGPYTEWKITDYTTPYNLKRFDGASSDIAIAGMENKEAEYWLDFSHHNWITKIWSNTSGSIGDWWIRSTDKFYVGDFDGDGNQELLCCAYTSSTTQSDLISMYGFQNGAWVKKWSNNGNSSTGNGIYTHRNKLVVGDFNGDGLDEIFGYEGTAKVVLYYDGTTFQLGWGNNGASSELDSYSKSFIVGDFDGDGSEELLGTDVVGTGYTAMFKLQMTGWQPNWVVIWRDLANPSPFKIGNRNLYAGDLNGDGKAEILTTLPLSQVTYASMVYNYTNGNLQLKYQGNDPTNPNPVNTILGKFDPTVNKQRIYNIDTWISQLNYVDGQMNWAWTSHGSDQFKDWQLSGGIKTRYIAIKPLKNYPAFVLAIRQNSVLSSVPHVAAMYGQYVVTPYTKPKSLIENPASGDFFTALENNTSNDNYSTSGISSSITDESLRLYPNPSDGNLSLDVDRDIPDANIAIYNLAGQLVYSQVCNLNQGVNRLDASFAIQSEGMHIVKIQTGDKVIVKKIMMKK